MAKTLWGPIVEGALFNPSVVRFIAILIQVLK